MAAGAVLGLSWGCGCIIKDCYTSQVAETVLGAPPASAPCAAGPRSSAVMYSIAAVAHEMWRAAASGRAALAVRSEEDA